MDSRVQWSICDNFVKCKEKIDLDGKFSKQSCIWLIFVKTNPLGIYRWVFENIHSLNGFINEYLLLGFQKVCTAKTNDKR